MGCQQLDDVDGRASDSGAAAAAVGDFGDAAGRGETVSPAPRFTNSAASLVSAEQLTEMLPC